MEEEEYKKVWYIYAGQIGINRFRGYIVDELGAKVEDIENQPHFDSNKCLFKKARVGSAFEAEYNGTTLKASFNKLPDRYRIINWKLLISWDTRNEANKSATKAQKLTEYQELTNLLNPIKQLYLKSNRDTRHYILAEIIRIITQ